MNLGWLRVTPERLIYDTPYELEAFLGQCQEIPCDTVALRRILRVMGKVRFCTTTRHSLRPGYNFYMYVNVGLFNPTLCPTAHENCPPNAIMPVDKITR